MLRVLVRKLGRAKILCLQGRIGVFETNTLSLAVHSQSDAKTVVLDFAQVIGIDAAGLGMLLELREWTKAVGTEFRLMNVTERVKQVLEITCLDSVFKISSEADVLFLATSDRPAAELAFVDCDQVSSFDHEPSKSLDEASRSDRARFPVRPL